MKKRSNWVFLGRFERFFMKISSNLHGCGDLTFGDGADDFVGSFDAFGTGAAGRRERTNKIVKHHRQKSNLAAVKSTQFRSDLMYIDPI